MSVLRICTAGNVDDGKSTLIGRLLVDSRAVLEDQLAAARQASAQRGADGLDLALLTDGLRAEREQGITIDVAYRYFATAKRKFVVADCPGHVEYTRNMVTGASTADVAVILVDATKELQEQTRRHCFVTSLLRVPHLVVCVNKMDLVGYSQERYLEVSAAIAELAKKLGVEDCACVPISALKGDNVVEKSPLMPWYSGRCLLDHLENLEPPCASRPMPLRLPVQCVILPKDQDEKRGYAGLLSCGAVREGDEVVLLPKGIRTKVASVRLGGEVLGQGRSPVSLTLHLRDELDVGRGDMIACPDDPPKVGNELEARLVWMSDKPLTPGGRYLLRHTTNETPAEVLSIDSLLDLHTLTETPGGAELRLNDFARVRLRTARPLCFDPYRRSRATGCLIVIDPATNATLGAGMIL